MAISRRIPYEIVLRAEDPKGEIDAEDLANFLRDLVFLHDRLWIIASGTDYSLDASFFYTRKGRPIPPKQRLKLTLVKRESPLELGLVIASAIAIPSAAFAFFQIVRGMLLIPGEKRIQRLEEQKLLKELEATPSPEPEAARLPPPSSLSEIYDATAGEQSEDQRKIELRLLQRDIQRISENEFRITEIEVKRTVNVSEATSSVRKDK